MGENKVAHLSQMLVIAATIMYEISHDRLSLPRCKFGYVTALRSWDVIKRHQNVFCQ